MNRTTPVIRISSEHRSCGCCHAQNYESAGRSPVYRRVDTIYEVVVGNMVNALCPDCLRLLAQNAQILLGEVATAPVKTEAELEQEAAITELAIQFARLWGERELNTSGSLLGDYLKSFDRDELTALMYRWAREYVNLKDEDKTLTTKPFVFARIRDLFNTYAKELG